MILKSEKPSSYKQKKSISFKRFIDSIYCISKIKQFIKPKTIEGKENNNWIHVNDNSMITTTSEKGTKTNTWKLSDVFGKMNNEFLIPEHFLVSIDENEIKWKPKENSRIWSTSTSNCFLTQGV